MVELFDRVGVVAAGVLGQQPMLGLALVGSIVCLVLCTVLARDDVVEGDTASGLGWAIYRTVARTLWALVVALLVLGSVLALRAYLHQVCGNFLHDHGRVTQANLRAVRTIWGTEQRQIELVADLGYEVEEVERLESEDPTRAALLRKVVKRHTITANPFVKARHAVTLTQSPRRKGPAVYPGYETECRFTYVLTNPAARKVSARLRFALPSSTAVFTDLTVMLDGRDETNLLRLEDSHLVCERDVDPGETFNYEITFRSRGLDYWYFQIPQRRQIRDFELVLSLADIPTAEVNYPEGCMTPTTLAATPDDRGSLLTYRLDRAISTKGMGVALPTLEQPGRLAASILGEVEKGWVLMFAAIVLALALTGNRCASLLTILFAAAVACGYGLLADLNDTFLGFWGGTIIVLVPVHGFSGWLLSRVVGGVQGRCLFAVVVVYGLLLPYLAGVDPDRKMLYLNLSLFMFVLLAAWMLQRNLMQHHSRTPAEK